MQIIRPFTVTAIAAGFALAGIAAVPAVAQTTAPEAPAAPAPEDYSEEQLTAFAEAAITVSEISNQYAAQLETVEDEEARQEIISEGNAEMLASVEDDPDITVDEYLEIGEAAAADPDLGQRISAMIQEMMEG